MKPLAAACFIAFVFVAAACDEDPPVVCRVDGVEHAVGATFPASDGCNTCTCGRDGEVSCTLMACVEPCTYAGVEREPGSSFPSEDGCNTCTCDTQGEVTCTAQACPPTTCEYGGQTHAVGASFPSEDGCNTCSCTEGGEVVCTLMPCVVTCTYNGQPYTSGDTFPSTDGCNTCSCGGDGTVGCTERECPVETCTYDRQTWEVGATFPAIDGCNTCTCMAGGQIACTEIACAQCNADTDWWRLYHGRSAEECAVIDYACVEWTTPFENDCGCGCEQGPECAEEIECFAPGCDYNTTVTKCPYSRIDTTPGCTVEKPCDGQSGFCAEPGAPFGCGICFRPEPGQECVDDAACSAQEARSICEPLHCSCGGERVCVAGCIDDASCDEGERCADSGRCVPKPCDGAAACPANFSCLPDGCVRTACDASSDCAGFCVLGYCYAEEGECRLPVP